MAATAGKVREMSLAIGAVLIVVGLLAAGLFAAGVVALIGLIAHDLVKSPKSAAAGAIDPAMESLRSAQRAKRSHRGRARSRASIRDPGWRVLGYRCLRRPVRVPADRCLVGTSRGLHPLGRDSGDPYRRGTTNASRPCSWFSPRAPSCTGESSTSSRPASGD